MDGSSEEHLPRPVLVSTSLVSDDLGLTPSLKQLLECPICKSTSIPPIYLCKQGHTVCHICKEKLEKCPICDDEYTTMRNELAESILGRCVFRCPYAQEGCPKSLKGSEVSQHYAECVYRPIKCNVHSKAGEPCGKILKYSQHIHHMKNDHGLIGVIGASAVIGMSASVKFGQGNWTFPAHYMNAYGYTFWCNLHASFNLLIGWVSMSGIEDELEKFAAAVTIFDQDQKWQQAKWVGGVHSVRATAKEVYDSGNCLTLLPETFLLLAEVYVDETGRKIKKWRCHFEIIEKEEKKVEPPNIKTDMDNNAEKGRGMTSVRELFAMAKMNDLEGEMTLEGGTEKSKDQLVESEDPLKEELEEPVKEQLEDDELKIHVKEQLEEPVKEELEDNESEVHVKELLENNELEEPVKEELEMEINADKQIQEIFHQPLTFEANSSEPTIEESLNI